MPAVLSDFTGKLIDAGRLEMLQPVGAGTYGEVYLTIDHHAPTSSGPVRRAIKVVQKAGPSKHDTQRQRREFAIHQLVSGVPGVQPLLEVHEDDAHFYLVSDYRDCDLFHLIHEGVTFEDNDERIRSVFVQILDAVHGCHQKKVYHRDLKPENILCTADGEEVFVADFGMATPVARSYTHGHGTQSYMSPECIGSGAPSGPYSTKHADIWALGLILVNLIAGGRRPWGEATLDDPDFRQFTEDDQYLEREYGISSGAADLLKRIFRMNPTTRPSIAQIRSNVLRLDTFFAEFEEDFALDGEEVDDTPDHSEGVSTPVDVPVPPIDISNFMGHPRPLLLPAAKRNFDDDFASAVIERLQTLDSDFQ
ncbi:kinase-like protein [Daedalea quercina L-15889]|uniref:non-specific serine/threonine protein kinase n=1 Tax=Daedalea quercina L-15889 TaxID=1314783 RepID=A0A165TL29_9APHY|nr:kinase-like protein [Daedalea quercina L-15889]